MTLTPFPHRPWWLRLWQQLVPPIPDFYGMLEAQADNLRTTVTALIDYLQAGDMELASSVHDLVEQGHALRDSTLSALYSSFITSIDREDIYTLTTSIDHILDYLKNTIRELEALQVQSDDWMQRMMAELADGAASLALALAGFRAGKAEDVARTIQTREAERRVEDLYRDALQNMFQGEEYLALTKGGRTACGPRLPGFCCHPHQTSRGVPPFVQCSRSPCTCR